MTTVPACPWTVVPDGIALTVRLTPNAAFDRIDGSTVLADGTPVLKARVRAVPEDGKANDALLRLIAATLGIASRQTRLVSGATGRLKRIAAEGNSALLCQRLEAFDMKSGDPTS